MASPVGHSIIGYSIYYIYKRLASRKSNTDKSGGFVSALYFILMANLFDYDYIRFNDWRLDIAFENHNRINHSIFYCAVFWCCAVLLTYYFKRKFSDYKLFCGLSGLAIISHLIIDYLCYDSNYTNGIGIPLFYPFSGKCYISKLVFFSGIDKTDVFSIFNFAMLLYEFAFAGCIFLLIKKIINKEN